MSDEQRFLITVRFPSWGDGDHKFPAFGVRYLFITDVIPFPDWPEEDERWLRYDESGVIVERFERWYKKTIKSEFEGEILFIEPFDVTVANAKGDGNG